MSGLDRPHGLAFHNGWLYIAWAAGVVRVHLDPTARPTVTPQQIVNYDSRAADHWTRSIAFGADSTMYIAIGSTCNLCVESEPSARR